MRFDSFATSTTPLALVLILAAVLRVGAVVAWHEHLSDDRDAYLRLARSAADGHGLSTSGARQPTAFRPPLYPLLLAAIFRAGGGSSAIGIVQILLGMATVWLTYLIGRRLKLDPGTSCLAAALVAVDPLLVQYTTFAMTETLFAFLVAGLLWFIASAGESTGADAEPEISHRGGSLRSAVAGAIFGLCALCRPTIWAYGGLLALWWILQSLRRAGLRRTLTRVPWFALFATSVVVLPWVIRNQLALGSPIMTTTHGGYTLLLGNNPVFYREVVNQPRGTVWEGESLSAWQSSLEVAMAQADPPVVGELARDRWMKRRAWQNIESDLPAFWRACWLRLRSLWNIVPQGEAAKSVAAPIRRGIGLYYGFLFFGCAWAVIRFGRADWKRWMPLLLLLIAFSLVHTVYWSNVRMRAPLVPVIALLAATGWARTVAGLRRNRSPG